ncbi:hypothetical protein KIW84_021013 [Lathyrus oleraceus]|uniref:Uncharacterized protein n=1 Tax=Pisum sativum TaxID=3888 RepID=A0A9D4Y6N8_PEA|nr:hypothetical protein KIW84_021013 [Pisum sativum]
MIIANKMRIHGDKMEDVTIIEKILRSMTAKRSRQGKRRGRGGYGRGDSGRSKNHINNPANHQNLDNSGRGKGRSGYREEAIEEPKWKNAMDEEITSTEKNNIWELVDDPQVQKRKPK